MSELYKLEELYSFLNEERKKKAKDIKEYRLKYDVRCKNCKTKMRAIKNDFKKKEECKKCWSSNSYEKENRKNIYGVVDGVWKKIKYNKEDWWYVK